MVIMASVGQESDLLLLFKAVHAFSTVGWRLRSRELEPGKESTHQPREKILKPHTVPNDLPAFCMSMIAWEYQGKVQSSLLWLLESRFQRIYRINAAVRVTAILHGCVLGLRLQLSASAFAGHETQQQGLFSREITDTGSDPDRVTNSPVGA